MTDINEATHTITAIKSHSVNVPAVRIAVTTPESATPEVPLGLSPIVVGTSPECDLVVYDGRVSRRHCEFSLTEQGIVLKDLKSKNGTFIGSIQIVEAILAIGGVVTVGGTSLTARVAGAPTVMALSPAFHFGDAIGMSLVMRALFAMLEHVAQFAAPVLLVGEAGTGKDLLAEALHQASPRRERPFVVFDCTALTPSTIEIELFGCVPGYLGGGHPGRVGLLEQAADGTLYINEPGFIPFEVQRKLLRVLEFGWFCPLGSGVWRTFGACTIAAMQQDPRAQLKDGSFLSGLHARLTVVQAIVPPLRDRKDDISMLVEHFLTNRSPRYAPSDLLPDTMELLVGHVWPGNVRELRNTVERLALYPHLGREALDSLPGAKSVSAGAQGAIYQMALREARELVVAEFEKSYLKNVLETQGGNVSKAAKAIGVSRQYLHRLLVHYGFTKDDH